MIDINIIEDILSEIFPGSTIDVNDQKSFVERYGMDSIAFVSYIVALEDKFAIEIPESYFLMSQLDTIEKTAKLIHEITSCLK